MIRTLAVATLLSLALAACSKSADHAPPGKPPEKPAAEKPAADTPAAKQEPHACDCFGLHKASDHPCDECGKSAGVEGHRYCAACAEKLHRCPHCGAALPKR